VLDRSSSKFKKHRFSYLFFFIVHVVFSCVIFSLHETVTVAEIVGILLVAPLFSLLTTEIICKPNLDYFVCLAVLKVILFSFVYFQHHVNEFMVKMSFLALG
jgi:hypothetical protein